MSIYQYHFFCSYWGFFFMFKNFVLKDSPEQCLKARIWRNAVVTFRLLAIALRFLAVTIVFTKNNTPFEWENEGQFPYESVHGVWGKFLKLQISPVPTLFLYSPGV